MPISDVIAHIDAEIHKLQQVRAMLSGSEDVTAPVKSGRGRPKGSKNAKSPKAPSATAATASPAVKGKRKLSPEGRKAIAEAMKRRWAERRKQSAK